MLAPGPAVLLRIYTEEGVMSGGRPLYEEIVLKARALGVAGATVLRGPMGYGQSSIVHTAKILDLSAKLPLVVEIVDAEDKIQALLAAMGAMDNIGLVTSEKVQVLHYGRGPATRT